MQAKNHVGFWLWSMLLSGLLFQVPAFYWGKPFLLAGAGLMIYYGFRAFLVYRNRANTLH